MKQPEIVGKKAYKNRGLFSGIIGEMQIDHSSFYQYVLVYKDGTRNYFNRLDEITIVED